MLSTTGASPVPCRTLPCSSPSSPGACLPSACTSSGHSLGGLVIYRTSGAGYGPAAGPCRVPGDAGRGEPRGHGRRPAPGRPPSTLLGHCVAEELLTEQLPPLGDRQAARHHRGHAAGRPGPVLHDARWRQRRHGRRERDASARRDGFPHAAGGAHGASDVGARGARDLPVSEGRAISRSNRDFGRLARERRLIRKGVVRAVLVVLAVALVGGLAFSWYVGGMLIQPALRPVAPPPPALAAAGVTFPSRVGVDDSRVVLARDAGTGRGVAVPRCWRGSVCDGRARVVPARARVFGAGDRFSGARRKRWGAHHRRAISSRGTSSRRRSYLHRALPEERIGAIGVSMGAAAVVLAKKPLGLSAVVLESMYPTIEEALDDRMKMALGPWGVICTPLLTAAIEAAPRDLSCAAAADRFASRGSARRCCSSTASRTITPESKKPAASSPPPPNPKPSGPVPGAAHVEPARFRRARTTSAASMRSSRST